ncbi:MAG: hypothetical protein ACFFFT_07755 [Candidatus Thorarchaeota archaeon]
MSKKVYICRECRYEFPSELSNLIEQNIQVYCEKCGSPFVLEGVEFKPAQTPVKRRFKPSIVLSESDSSKLEGIIQFLNKISFLPIFIVTIISFGLIALIAINLENWISILVNQSFLGFIGLFLLIYDRAYIAPKIKEKKYNEIFLDSFCWGILGCILFGTGVIILINGILVFIYVVINRQNKDLKVYHYGLLAKNSLNYLSTKAGFLIILIAIYTAYLDKIYIATNDYEIITKLRDITIRIPIILVVFLCLMLIAIIALILDGRLKSDLKTKLKFELGDSIKVFIIGILGTIFYASGIFILLKGILIFFLSVGKPSGEIQMPPTEEISAYSTQHDIHEKPRVISDEDAKKKEPKEPIIEPTPTTTMPKEKEPIIEKEARIEEELSKVEELEEILAKEDKERKEEEIELRLHESLLPVKNEKDKKLVKEYFSKIFAVLSKDLRQQISNLKISKKERRELLEELAFLNKEEQVKYVEAIVDLYKEIPKKLIERIRKLPNVKPQYINNLIDQLKFMDAQEQIKFVQFLEENA